MSNLKKNSPVTTKPAAFTVKAEELHVFPPRSPEEAQTRSVFVKDGLTYCHFNGNLSSGVLGTPGTTGLVLAYGELADKIGDLVMDAHRTGKTERARKLTITADINVEITPVMDGGGNITGNNITLKVYGFEHGGKYFTTKGGSLVVTESKAALSSSRTAKVSFFG